MSKVLRTLTWFDKKTDEWIGEILLRGVKLQQLQKLFEKPADEPMYDCYKVQRRHLPVIQKWVEIPIALNKYDYFVECTAIGVPQTAATGN